MSLRRWLPPGLPRTVYALGLISLLTDVSSEMIAPVLPAFLTATLRAGAVQLGLIEGIADATAAVLKLLSGRWSDRLRRRTPLIAAGYSLSGLMRPLIGLASSWWWVLVCRFSDRIGKGLRSAPRDALIADFVDPAQRGAAFGLHRAMDHLGAVVGPLLAALLLLLGLPPQRVILLAALPAIAVLIALRVGLREAPHEVATSEAPRLEAAPLEWSKVLPLLVALFIRALGTPAEALLLLKLTQEHLSLPQVALVWSLHNMIRVLVALRAGSWADRSRPRSIALLGWVAQAALLWIFAAVVDRSGAVVAFLAYALASGISEPAEATFVAQLAPESSRGRVFGWYHMTVGLGALPAGVLIGSLWDAHGPSIALGLASSLLTAAAFLVFFLTRSQELIAGADKPPGSS